MNELHVKFWPRKLSRHLSLPQTSVWFNVEVSATRFPDHPCIDFYDGVTTYRAFKQQAERLAGFLQKECGVRRGDRVALYLQNSPQFMIAYYAILRADAVVVPLNCMYLAHEISQVMLDSGARVIVTAQELYPRVEPLLGKGIDHAIVGCYSDYLGASPKTPVPEVFAAARARFSAPGVTLWCDALARELVPAPHESTADDLCVMPYTSGTTGKPKGCMHRHSGVMHTAVTVAHWHDVRQDERILAVLPFFHVTGMQNSMNMPIYAGATIILLPRWDRDVAAQLIERHRVTGVTAVPAMVVDLIGNPNITRYDLSSLRAIGGGGAAMPEAVARKLKELCGLTYIEGYGLTETLAPSHINPDDRPKEQCLGIPVFDVDSRIIDPETLKELPQGETGEIVTHGPQVLEGYWKQPAENESCFLTLDGKRFFRTGDLGRIDAEGYFFFVDRLKRMINAAGFKVWPAEVESLLYAHPAIQEAMVIAKKDERTSKRIKAIVVPKAAAHGKLTAEQIMEWARERMAAYKVPREIEFVESLPRSATGKINWRLLQEEEAARGT